MGYEHLNINPEMKSNEDTESNAENLLPILSKCEVTLEDEIECDMPSKDNCSPLFTTFLNPLFKDDDNFDSSDDESLPDPHCFNVESDFVESLLNRDTFIDFSSKFDFSGELAHINLEIPKSDFDFEEEIRLIQIQDGNSQQEEIDIVIETDDVLPPSVENDDDYDPLLGEADLFLSDNSIPPEIPVVMNDKDEDVDYSSFLFVIYPEMFLLLLSAERLFPEIEAFLCWNFCPVFKIFTSFD
nr:hypothetical protein [Tanacetum cinerariifolium]